MSIQNLQTSDPFAEADLQEAGSKAVGQDYVHIRIQQRNGRKSLTTVQGLGSEFDFKNILKALKKLYCCNGTIVEDEELGTVLQLTGDQRKNVHTFLTEQLICTKSQIKIHGF